MVITETIILKTKGDTDVIDITPQLEKHLVESNLENGVVTVFVTGSTAGITTIEYEPGLVADIKEAFERIAPKSIPYAHNERWGDGNGYSHIRASLLGASIVIPFENKKMVLGTWQQIVLVDFDNRARSRQIVVQIMGE
ncbi:MAG: secondary thiamine-phosphate synthase enzyme YjbQ [Dehalococcoidales bacterium]|jgi:secondary thiamine-phosphate synthase enzyme|nr:secondary thiamine-phosphate synthase enzyme YjbQ [Dehalococcoidales bacterium]